MTYLRNVWYMAAWAEEVVPAAPLARTILEEPLVFFRTSAGAITALADRCPHRFAPLSWGDVRDGVITCRYHGLGFDGGGACVANPHGPISKNARVRAYPVQERHRAVWIWMGEPEAADVTLIPDLSFLADAPDAAFSSGYLELKANYELLVDNILDLSHTDFLHPDTLGGGMITRTKPDVAQERDAIRVSWNAPGAKPPPLIASLFPPELKNTDVWTEVIWSPPGVMRLSAGAVASGRPRSEGFENRNVHIATPRDERTTHYFFGASRNFATGDAALNERIAAARFKIFSTEDEPMLEAVQQRMGDTDFWSLKPVILAVDAAPVLVRRHLQRLISAERAAA
ncbi:MAG: Rieske 2Fe-2S domain-containing protein [Hyphomonadaceae bacterium]